MLETIRIPKLHISTLHILSQLGSLCMGLGFQRAAVKSATDNIIVSPPLLRHLRSYDLCLLNWTSRTGNVLRSYSLCANWKSKAIMYHTVCKRSTLKMLLASIQDGV